MSLRTLQDKQDQARDEGKDVSGKSVLMFSKVFGLKDKPCTNNQTLIKSSLREKKKTVLMFAIV